MPDHRHPPPGPGHASVAGTGHDHRRRRRGNWLRFALLIVLPACSIDPAPAQSTPAATEETRMPADTTQGHTPGRNPDGSVSQNPAPTASDELLRAAQAADPAALRELIVQGANPDGRNADGEPLLRVAQLAGQWDNVQLLVEHGADVNAHPPSRPGDTVLAFYSAGQFDKVHWLLEHGADPGYRIEAAAEPARVGAQPIIENIYWWPVQAASYPSLAQWQRKSQDLLAERGHAAPPQPPHLRKLQQAQEAEGQAAVPLDEAIDAAEQRVRAGLGNDGSR